jgi:DNA processing protein
MGGFASDEQRVVAGLWALAGTGAVSIGRVLSRHRGALDQVLDLPLDVWLPQLGLRRQAREAIESAHGQRVRTVREAADLLWYRCELTRVRIAFAGDPDYPRLLTEIRQPPALLFFQGPGAGGSQKPAVAMVGTRRAPGRAEANAFGLAFRLAYSGVVVVSGAAEGIDTSCHRGALAARGETWAFLGSALDALDAAPRRIAEPILDGGGTLFTQFPPGVRGDETTFARRNRLISGASAVTVVVRAPQKSGALLTARYAREQGRVTLAVPGEVDELSAVGSNGLLRRGEAQTCVEAEDVAEALGLGPGAILAPPTARATREVPADLGAEAKQVLQALSGRPMDYDTLLAACALSSGQLSAALTTLEIAEVVLEGAGRVYYRA